jgi:hypothetical protein
VHEWTPEREDERALLQVSTDTTFVLTILIPEFLLQLPLLVTNDYVIREDHNRGQEYK